ncbi:EsaB/YukD family protein [Streptomyces sp. TLI_171]|uniref:EsaB/YukD family protein n=1 Tax=Streptomyces sp. TLI_171 TaxID=1938859 RepID=UPI000FEF2E76|nr:EsaB/YukD family protein [Streptomyces sp. TLI_171]RKE22122.1 type VII secretion system (Wss) protein YukD [Streptomyces sp. TLI_171]
MADRALPAPGGSGTGALPAATAHPVPVPEGTGTTGGTGIRTAAAPLPPSVVITVELPDVVLDLTLPADLPAAELLPVVIRAAGEETAEAGVDHGGWDLHTPDGAPVDPEAPAGALDGAGLRLLPRPESRREPHYDDLIDGISVSVHALGHSWTPEAARRTLRVASGLAAAVLLAALLVPAVTRTTDRTTVTTLAGLAAVLFALGALAAARAAGDASTAVVLATATTAFAALTGWRLPASGAHGWAGTTDRLLPAAALAGAWALTAFLALGAWPVLTAQLALTALVSVGYGALIGPAGLAPAHAAAAVAPLVALLAVTAPRLGRTAARFHPSPLPTVRAALPDGARRAERAERDRQAEAAWTAGLRLTAAVLTSATGAVLAVTGGVPGQVTAGVWALLFLLTPWTAGLALRSAASVLPTLAVAVAAGLPALLGARTVVQSGVAAGLAVACVLLAAGAARTVAGAPPGPPAVPAVPSWRVRWWGRIGPAMRLLAATALLPLTVWVFNGYALVAAARP